MTRTRLPMIRHTPPPTAPTNTTVLSTHEFFFSSREMSSRYCLFHTDEPIPLVDTQVMTAVWEVDNKNVLMGITVVVVVKVAVVVTMIIMMGVVVSISCSTTAVLMMREVALMLSRSMVHVQRKERNISYIPLLHPKL